MGSLDEGRTAFEQHRWRDAYEQLKAADAEVPLELDDLEHLASAAHLIGRDADVSSVWARAHNAHIANHDPANAARCAFWIALPLVARGDRAQGGGWIARGNRLLDESPSGDCAVRGYLLFARALGTAMGGDPRTARTLFSDAVAIGERFHDASLVAFARHGEGRSLIGLGLFAEGAALLDEAMAAIAAGEVSPMLVGDVYCSMLDACHEMLDIRRAREWTNALHDWGRNQPGSTMHRGVCLVHRAELLTIGGAWPSAEEEAERALECLSAPPPHGALGGAFYQVGELHRLRGDFARAEEAFRQASHTGRDPQPGLALLRLRQGRSEVARTAIARAMDDPGHRQRRTWILPAAVEIMIAAGDMAAARRVAEMLSAGASTGGALHRAMAADANGSVLLAEGDAHRALAALDDALAIWEDLDAPYDAARTRARIGLAWRALGDEDSARLLIDSASAQLVGLGAVPDAEWAASLLEAEQRRDSDALTPRETEVLCMVATGKTNRAVAVSLGISEKTVARHVSNIFFKLGISSRSAATAYAYEKGLLGART